MYLRPEDQKTIVAITVGLALLAGISTAWYAWRCGGLAHVDRLPKNDFTFQVDLNKADWTEISTLPEIGEKMARRIIEFREQNGPFTSLQSVTRVKGIGSHTIKAIQPYVDLPLSDKMVADSQ